MKGKKGMAMETMIKMALLVVILLVIAVGVIYRGIIPKQKEILQLSPEKDILCKGIPITKGDMDKDDRDDYICDWCVCEKGKGCNNNIVEEGGDDHDGDGLPVACDEDDDLKTGKTKRSFPNSKCIEDNLISLGGTWGQQCRPS